MGAPMAGRLADGGYDLVLYDLHPAGMEPLLARGAERAGSLRAR